MVEEWDEKLSSSAAELPALQAAKDKAEAELDHNFKELEELLKQCFDRAVRQAYVHYGGSRAIGKFDLSCEVYQGRLVPSAEEDGPTKAEEGECVEVQE